MTLHQNVHPTHIVVIIAAGLVLESDKRGGDGSEAMAAPWLVVEPYTPTQSDCGPYGESGARLAKASWHLAPVRSMMCVRPFGVARYIAGACTFVYMRRRESCC